MIKKVLFVATGAIHIKGFHSPYLKLFQDNGYKTYAAARWNIRNNGKMDYCDKFVQISIKRSPYSLKNIKAIKELKELISKEKFDIIHCHTPMGSVVARIAARKARKKNGTRVIYTAHGFHFYKGAPIKNWLLFYPVEWYLAKYTDTIITINKEDYNLAKNKFYKRCKNIEYVPGVGIDTKKFDIKMTEKEKNDLKKSVGLNEDDFVLTCVARLDRNKNQVFLIDTMKKIIKKNNKIHLLLVGTDELNGYYQKIVKDQNLDSNIHFLGRREDIPELLQITDVVVSASKREGLPVNVMEAIASGTPVVALECRGMRDLVKNGKNGFVIGTDVADCSNFFALKILDCFEERIQVEKKDINDFSIENTVKLMKEIYFNNK